MSIVEIVKILTSAGIEQSEANAEVKMLIENRQIKRNGETESARRRKLHAGDIIEIEGLGAWRVVTK